MNIDDETLSNLIEKSINIQYDETSFTYKVHTRSDTAITVTNLHRRRVREPHGGLVAHSGIGSRIFLVSRAIGTMVERTILRGTDVEFC